MKHLAVLLAVLILMGCGKSIAGTWKGGQSSISGDSRSITVTLNADKTFTFQLDSIGTGSSGIYELKRDEIRLIATEAAGVQIPKEDQTVQIATLSDDRKSFTLSGTTFTKQ